jgi:hypothetical protein
MKDFILLMHDDVPPNEAANTGEAWTSYLRRLRESGRFSGGSSIGAGKCFAKVASPKPITAHLSGYLRVQAESLEEASKLLTGNPVFEAGGTVEIRELPRD